jgi:hypothetical protein
MQIYERKWGPINASVRITVRRTILFNVYEGSRNFVWEEYFQAFNSKEKLIKTSIHEMAIWAVAFSWLIFTQCNTLYANIFYECGALSQL